LDAVLQTIEILIAGFQSHGLIPTFNNLLSGRFKNMFEDAMSLSLTFVEICQELRVKIIFFSGIRSDLIVPRSDQPIAMRIASTTIFICLGEL
jgi:hypothetical protein